MFFLVLRFYGFFNENQKKNSRLSQLFCFQQGCVCEKKMQPSGPALPSDVLFGYILRPSLKNRLVCKRLNDLVKKEEWFQNLFEAKTATRLKKVQDNLKERRRFRDSTKGKIERREEKLKRIREELVELHRDKEEAEDDIEEMKDEEADIKNSQKKHKKNKEKKRN